VTVQAQQQQQNNPQLDSQKPKLANKPRRKIVHLTKNLNEEK